MVETLVLFAADKSLSLLQISLPHILNTPDYPFIIIFFPVCNSCTQ